MSVDVGEIQATLEVDRDPFQAGLDAAQSSAEQFVADPYTATLAVDAEEAEAEVAKLRAELESLTATPYLITIGVADDSAGPLAGLEDLGAGAETLDSQLADLATQADTTAVSFDSLGVLADEQIDTLGGLGDAAALASDDVGGLSASLGTVEDAAVPAARGLEGFLAQAEALGGPFGGLGAISAGAEAAGIDVDTFVSRLERLLVSPSRTSSRRPPWSASRPVTSRPGWPLLPRNWRDRISLASCRRRARTPSTTSSTCPVLATRPGIWRPLRVR